MTCDPGGENGLIEPSLIHTELEAAQSRFPIYSSTIFRRTANDADDDDDEEEAIINAREYMRHEGRGTPRHAHLGLIIIAIVCGGIRTDWSGGARRGKRQRSGRRRRYPHECSLAHTICVASRGKDAGAFSRKHTGYIACQVRSVIRLDHGLTFRFIFISTTYFSTWPITVYT